MDEQFLDRFFKVMGVMAFTYLVTMIVTYALMPSPCTCAPITLVPAPPFKNREEMEAFNTWRRERDRKREDTTDGTQSA